MVLLPYTIRKIVYGYMIIQGKKHFCKGLLGMEMRLDKCGNGKKSIIMAISTTLILFLIVMLRGTAWEVSDDVAFAWLISRDGNHFTGFLGKILSYIIHIIYMFFPVIEWWMLFSVIIGCIGSGAIVFLISKHYEGKYAYLVSALITILYYMVGLRIYNFTRTAIMIAFPGVMLISDALLKCNDKKSIFVQFSVGFIFVLLGFSIRWECGIIAIAFMCLYGMFYVINKEGILKWIINHKNRAIMLMTVIMLIIIYPLFHNLLMIDEEKNFIKYNDARSMIQDYSEQIPEWQAARELYDDLGLNWDDMDLLLYGWTSEDTEVYSQKKLERIADAYYNNISMERALELLLEYLYSSRKVLMMCMMIIFSLLIINPRRYNVICSILLVAIAFSMCFYLSWFGRIMERVIEPIFLCATSVLTFLCGSAKKFDKLAILRNALLVIIAVIASMLFYDRLTIVPNMTRIKQHTNYAVETKEEYCDVLNQSKENVYILRNFDRGPQQAFDIWTAFPKDYCDNVFYYGGWEARIPYNVDRLNKYGIDNPMRALFENDNVYTTYDKDILEFLQTHYDQYMTACKVKDEGKWNFIQYCRLINDEDVMEEFDGSVEINSLKYGNIKGDKVLYIKGELMDVVTDEIKAVYCNLDSGKLRHTYKLNFDEGSFEGWMYLTTDMYDVDIDDINIQIIGKNINGELGKIK